MATAGAGERGIWRGGEHLGEALAAEAVAALEEKRAPLLFVVLVLAHRTTRHPHIFCQISPVSCN